MVHFVVLLKNKGYPLKILLKSTRGFVNKKNSICNFRIWSIPNDFVQSLVSEEASAELSVSVCSLFFLCSQFLYVLSSFSVCLFCFFSLKSFLFVFSLSFCLFVASPYHG